MKNQRFVMITVSLLILSMPSFSQIDSFKITDYYLPHYDRKELEFTINLNNSYSGNREKESIDNIRIQNRIRINQLLDINYRRFKNTSSLQSERNYYFFLDNNSKFNKNENSILRKNDIYNFNTLIGLQNNYRFYGDNKYYFELSPEVNYGYEHHRDIRDYVEQTDIIEDIENIIQEIEDINNQHELLAKVDFRLGKGRIEPVEDARQLIYILSELRDYNRLIREPTEQEMLKISQEISRIKNKRFLDFRNRRKAELVYVDSVLQSYGLINEKDAIYFTTLNDYWSFAALPQRSSGYRLSMGIKPEFIFLRRDIWMEYATPSGRSVIDFLAFNYDLAAAFNIRLINTKPVHLNRQRIFRVEAEYIPGKTFEVVPGTHNEDIGQSFRTDYVNLLGHYEYNLYPNSRSQIGMKAHFLTSYTKMLNDKGGFISDEIIYNIGLSAQAFYFVSPNVSIQTSLGYNYFNKTIEPETYFDLMLYDNLIQDFYFNLGFFYTFF